MTNAAKEKDFNNQDIIILSAAEWCDNPVSTMHISAILSKTNNVVFVETPGGRMPKLSELGRVLKRIKKLFCGVHQSIEKGLDPQNVKILSPLAIPLPKYRLVRWLNNCLLTFQIRRLMKKLNLRNPLLWVFSPHWLTVVNKINHKGLVFHCVDALRTYDSTPHFKKSFIEIATKADVVFTPGKLIYEELIKLNSNTHLIGHGCSDLHLNYKVSDIPAKIKNTCTPRVVYAGCLANWVDYDLLYEVANKLPQYSFILLGYIHSLAPLVKVNMLISLPNVYHLGYVNYAKLPAFYHASDVGIIPYQADNEHIRYCTPTKILDYFAAGLPCVSTRYPAVEGSDNLIGVADNADEFVKLLKDNIKNNNSVKDELRYEYARQYCWDNQVNKMLELVVEKL